MGRQNSKERLIPQSDFVLVGPWRVGKEEGPVKGPSIQAKPCRVEPCKRVSDPHVGSSGKGDVLPLRGKRKGFSSGHVYSVLA